MQAKDKAKIEVEAFELGAEHAIKMEMLTKAKLVSKFSQRELSLRFVCSIDFRLGERGPE